MGQKAYKIEKNEKKWGELYDLRIFWRKVRRKLGKRVEKKDKKSMVEDKIVAVFNLEAVKK